MIGTQVAKLVNNNIILEYVLVLGDIEIYLSVLRSNKQFIIIYWYIVMSTSWLCLVTLC